MSRQSQPTTTGRGVGRPVAAASLGFKFFAAPAGQRGRGGERTSCCSSRRSPCSRSRPLRLQSTSVEAGELMPLENEAINGINLVVEADWTCM